MKRFFTLIELLVVIAIISVLMTLLLPALSNAKFMAKRSVCAGQLKQISLALNNYLNDYSEWFPRDGNSAAGQDMRGSPLDWQKLGLLYVNGYIKSREIFECPARSYDDWSAFSRNRNCGYTYLIPGMSNSSNKSVRLNDFITKKHFVSGKTFKLKGNIACYLENPEFGAAKTKNLVHKNRGLNFLCFDSSVTYLLNPGSWGGPYWSPSLDKGNANDYVMFWWKATTMLDN